MRSQRAVNILMTLRQFLKDQIQAHGPMDIGQFMSLALGHPQFGYYMKKDPFGVDGDFTTAPEISQIFGEMLGAWVANVWMKMGAPEAFTFLECGPGRGTLIADMLRATKGVEGFHKAARIHLLEMSPVLKEMQKEKLIPLTLTLSPKGRGDVIWHDALETIPRDQPIITIANEFLDALPVRQFQKTKDGWMERVVQLNGDAFEFGLAPASFDFSGGDEGDVFEAAPSRVLFTRGLCEIMRYVGGVGLFIDYGHIATGYGDTLQAVYKHQYCSVLENIGDADLTSHVDFEMIAVEAKIGGAKVYGPVEQGAFLKTLGIEARARALANKATPSQQDDIQKALHRLTDSSEMGRLFKVMGFSHALPIPPAGF